MNNNNKMKETIIKQTEDLDTSTLQKPVESLVEQGGRSGLDPVRYGDWEKNGRCIDF
jgi:hypothetical protein